MTDALPKEPKTVFYVHWREEANGDPLGSRYGYRPATVEDITDEHVDAVACALLDGLLNYERTPSKRVELEVVARTALEAVFLDEDRPMTDVEYDRVDGHA